MKAIGFTTKFYTLWDITSEKSFNTNHLGQVTQEWDRVIYTYLGNLSFDLPLAQQKAIEKGCIDIEPNLELYGRNKSWEKVINKKDKFENCERDELLMICCSNAPENTKERRESAIKVLISKGMCKMVNGILTISEKVEEMEKFFADRNDFLNSSVSDSFLIDKNCDNNGVVEMFGNTLYFANGVKSNYYKGFNYYLPLDEKGKQKRIKNKSIKLVDFSVEKNCDDLPYGLWEDSKTNTKFFTEKKEISFIGTNEVKIKKFDIIK